MPRQRYTLEQLKARLRERAGNNATFWTEPELKDALNEAISVWQALTGEWTTRQTITAKSDSPSFYPVPKNIVSLTRVGIGSEAEAENPLRGYISLTFPVVESEYDQSTLHTGWGLDIPMRWMPEGGVAPYTVVWDFGDGTNETNDGSTLYHALEVPDGVDPLIPYLLTITATVTDAAGDVLVCTRQVWVVDPTVDFIVDDISYLLGAPPPV